MFWVRRSNFETSIYMEHKLCYSLKATYAHMHVYESTLMFYTGSAPDLPWHSHSAQIQVLTHKGRGRGKTIEGKSLK